MRLFISYAHVDKAIVKDWIVNKLLAGGYNVWFDDNLVVGQDWKQQLSDKIQTSDALVYCMTPESIASDWCKWELARAVDLGKPVVPVLLKARTQLPDQLKRLQYVDFSNGATGDAVARLMGGLQNLSPAQLPPAPASLRGNPAQIVPDNQQQEDMQEANNSGSIGCANRVNTIAVIISIIAIVIVVLVIFSPFLQDNILSEAIRLYRDEGSITLYIPEGQTINLDDWYWGLSPESKIPLSYYRTFGNGEQKGPACYRLEYQHASQLDVPDICPPASSSEYKEEIVALSDVFWHRQDSTNSHPEIRVFHNNDEVIICAQNARDCKGNIQEAINIEWEWFNRILTLIGVIAGVVSAVAAVIAIWPILYPEQ